MALAKSFGIEAYKPSDVGELKKILRRGMDKKQLTVIEIPISTDVNEKLINELESYFS